MNAYSQRKAKKFIKKQNVETLDIDEMEQDSYNPN